MKRLELLVVRGGALSGRRFQVRESGVRLGRSSSNDIPIPDEELSRSHCLFELSGDDAICVTDLASANGTLVNGEALGAEPRTLKAGDEIAVGASIVAVVAPGAEYSPASGEVDLGLGSGRDEKAAPAAAGRRRSPLANILWCVAVLAMVGGIVAILSGDGFTAAGSKAPAAVQPEKERVVEMNYEKIAADSTAVFRYSMSLSPDGLLRVAIDDVSGEKRHLDKPKRLSPEAAARLGEILLDPELSALEDSYAGPDGEPPVLNSWRLRIVTTGRVKDVRIVNTQEPEAFRRAREKLEVFSKNELGIWAIQRTRAQLLALAADCAETGRVKWEDRDVEHGNLFRSIAAYREAIFYLDTVNPKPPEFAKYQRALEEAQSEQARRFQDQRFRADRAINLKDWEAAREELKVLCEIVSDREDERYREAAAKLVDVEKTLSKGGRR